MVKRVPVLDREVDADVPYEATRLAQRAPAARRRLVLLLAAAALALVAAAFVAKSVGAALGAAIVVGAAWGVHRGRLGGVLAAAALALFLFLLPLRTVVVDGASPLRLWVVAATVLWGLACLPDVVLLVRDAELQHAYGRWARRPDM